MPSSEAESWASPASLSPFLPLPGLGLCRNWASLGSCSCGGLRYSYLSAWALRHRQLLLAPSAGGLVWSEERPPCPQPGQA